MNSCTAQIDAVKAQRRTDENRMTEGNPAVSGVKYNSRCDGEVQYVHEYHPAS